MNGPGVDPFVIAMLSFPAVGAFVASRQPRNAIGWIMLGIGGLGAIDAVLAIYTAYALDIRPGSLPRPDVALAIRGAMWVPVIGVMGTFLILLFPDGRLPTLRWRRWAQFCAAAIILPFFMILVAPGSYGFLGYPDITNPMGIEALRPFMDAAFSLLMLIPIAIVGCAVALIQRFRRSHGQERLQLKWFAGAAGVVAALYLAMMALSLPYNAAGRPPPDWIEALNVSVMSFVLIPVAAGIAILKYRLYDIDIIINKTVVYTTLAGFVTAVYVAIVVGVGAVVNTGGRPNLALSIAATAIVAIAFDPVRRRVQRFANRLVFGERATPYEVLSRFSETIASSYGVEELLPRTAAMLRDATGATQACVWLRVDDSLVVGAVSPTESIEQLEPRRLSPDGLPALPGSLSSPVYHQGELLGVLTITKGRGESVTPAERELLASLASQAGQVLRNARLTSELQARLDQLATQAHEIRLSRQRIVAAQDDERRGLERNIHDGAQQHLVALAVKLKLARTLAGRAPERAEGLLDELRHAVDDAVETLRELAAGVYPAALENNGLAAALTEQAGAMPVRTEIHADVTHLPLETAATVYF
ncbi:MAG: histidine kinase, partial [Actinomycetota bacterium]|nr:histidine kinase [Actinomycetota bacterium]